MKTLTLITLLFLSSCTSGIVISKTQKPITTIEVPSFTQYNGQTIQKVTNYTTPNEYEVTILTSKGKEKTYFVPTEIADTLQIGKKFNTFDLIR